MEINDKGRWQLHEPRRMAEMMRERDIRGVVFHKDAEGMFYPPDIGAYERVFETVFDNRFGTVMAPRTGDEPRPDVL